MSYIDKSLIVVDNITEYMSIILCLHKAARKQIKLNWKCLIWFGSYMLFLYIIEKNGLGKWFLYLYLFVYTRLVVINRWKSALKAYVMTICAVPMMQLLLYGVIGDTHIDIVNNYLLVTTIMNMLIIIFLIIWKEKYLHYLVNFIIRFRKVIFLVLLLFLLKCLISYYLEYKVIDSHYMGQIVICFLIVALMLILWINSENEKRHKMEELRTYKLYTDTFEDAIAAIRMRQHEFDNHINAIRCMQYTIHDAEKLIEEQNKYCDKILHENRYNKLLKANTSPILIGYLYSKFTAASAQGVKVNYEIQDIDIGKIAINDLIEITGIIFDNAVEALEQNNDKDIAVKMLCDSSRLIVSIANISERKTNSEIEKFFEYGYSTKGDGRGVGLHRANMLLKKYKGNIQIENIDIYGANYLCFNLIFHIK